MFSIYLSVDIRLFSFCVKYKIVYLVVVCLSKNEPFQSDLVLWYRRSNKNVIAYFDDSKRISIAGPRTGIILYNKQKLGFHTNSYRIQLHRNLLYAALHTVWHTHLHSICAMLRFKNMPIHNTRAYSRAHPMYIVWAVTRGH